MSSIVGLIALHALLIGLGGAALWAGGLVDGLRGSTFRVLSAMGPSYVVGVALLMPWLIVALLVDVPASFATSVIVALLGIGLMLMVGLRLGRLRGHPATTPPATPTRAGDGRGASAGPWVPRPARAVALLAGTGFAVWVIVTLARLPTGGDDARIWSLRGVTLADYSRLVPEIFLNPGQSGDHPAYPLLQPQFEATVSHALGHAAPSFFHAELWLLLICAAWTAAYLIWRRRPEPGIRSVAWVPVVAVLAVIPAEIANVVVGDADTTGSIFLALGVLCAGLWLDVRNRSYLALSAVMLVAAANTKDEDMSGAIIVVAIVLGVTLFAAALRSGRRRKAELLWPVLALVAYFVALVAPWRLWLKVHHLTDGVQPPIPQALSPVFFFGRSLELHQTLTAMASQVLGEWDWLVAIFIVVSGICLTSARTRRMAAFYLVTFSILAFSLVWLYTTTPAPLGYLLATSMSRTIAVFMAVTPLAVAHLLAVAVSDRAALAASASESAAGSEYDPERGELPSGAAFGAVTARRSP